MLSLPRSLHVGRRNFGVISAAAATGREVVTGQRARKVLRLGEHTRLNTNHQPIKSEEIDEPIHSYRHSREGTLRMFMLMFYEIGWNLSFAVAPLYLWLSSLLHSRGWRLPLFRLRRSHFQRQFPVTAVSAPPPPPSRPSRGAESTKQNISSKFSHI